MTTGGEFARAHCFYMKPEPKSILKTSPLRVGRAIMMGPAGAVGRAPYPLAGPIVGYRGLELGQRVGRKRAMAAQRLVDRLTRTQEHARVPCANDVGQMDPVAGGPVVHKLRGLCGRPTGVHGAVEHVNKGGSARREWQGHLGPGRQEVVDQRHGRVGANNGGDAVRLTGDHPSADATVIYHRNLGR